MTPGSDTADIEINDTDRAILRHLAAGRETRASIADAVDKHENYISDRLKLLRLQGYVSYYHKPSALYKITESGREQVEKK